MTAAASKYKIRRCAMDDLEPVLRIENASFPDPYDRRTFAYFIFSDPDGFLVAEDDGSIVGCVVTSTREGHGLIISIAVAPERKREGIGSKLLEAALRHLATRSDEVYLQVSVKNLEAIDFYHKFSFREAGLIKNYYQNGDDAYVMVLKDIKNRARRDASNGPRRTCAKDPARLSPSIQPDVVRHKR
jgi:ribosomal-protein-alanine N-acetyltransferase